MSNNENIFIEPWIEEEGWNIEDFSKIETPSYVISLSKLENNLKILKSIEERTGCHVLMALKGFSMFSTFPLIKKYLSQNINYLGPANACRNMVFPYTRTSCTDLLLLAADRLSLKLFSCNHALL